MEKVYDRCCGIDVYKKLIVACFRQGNRQEVREFGATTRELLGMADWLRDVGWRPWRAQHLIGSPCSCCIGQSVKLKMTVKKLDRGSLCFFGCPIGFCFRVNVIARAGF